MVAPIYYDRVKEYTNTTGTGPLVLLGAVPSYHTFSSYVSDGARFHYTVYGANDSETGIGTYVAATNTITRGTILTSTNSNNIVSLAAGTKVVILALPSRILNGMTKGYSTITTTMTLDDRYHVIFCNNTSDITLNLPPVANYDNFSYLIKKIGNNTAKITLDGSGTEAIEGNLTLDLLLNGDYIEICPDGVGWRIINDGIIRHKTKCFRGTPQSIGFGVTTQIQLDTTSYDLGGLFSIPDYGVKVKRAGKYNVMMSLGFTYTTPQNNAEIWLGYYLNGAVVQWQLMTAGASNANAAVGLCEQVNLAIGDIVSMYTWQGIGTVSTNMGAYIPKLSLEELR